ncbi:hypothetical protein GQ600_26150 [Phytophthora cactorum]|nr:hypothetical protein GQ600_26150 [Phytophthora cactorum]
MSYNNCILDHLVGNKGTINYCHQAHKTHSHEAPAHVDTSTRCVEPLADRIRLLAVRRDQGEHCGLCCEEGLGTGLVGQLNGKALLRRPGQGRLSASSGCECKSFAISLWPKQGLGGGWGIYWGQQVNLDDMLEHLDDGELEIVSHEMGNGFGLPDFY